MKIVFQYILLLSQNELKEWVFHELQQLGQIQYGNYYLIVFL